MAHKLHETPEQHRIYCIGQCPFRVSCSQISCQAPSFTSLLADARCEGTPHPRFSDMPHVRSQHAVGNFSFYSFYFLLHRTIESNTIFLGRFQLPVRAVLISVFSPHFCMLEGFSCTNNQDTHIFRQAIPLSYTRDAVGMSPRIGRQPLQIKHRSYLQHPDSTCKLPSCVFVCPTQCRHTSGTFDVTGMWLAGDRGP